MAKIRFLVCVVTAFFATTAAAAATAAEIPHPIVLLFASRYPAKSDAAKPADTPEPDLNLQALRAVRRQILDSKIADAIAYQPESLNDTPIFRRALLEAKLTINEANPTEADRIALGKALGAFAVVTVSGERGRDGLPGITVSLNAITLATQKTWTEKAQISIVKRTDPRFQVPANAAPPPFSDEVASASNTVVLKFLAGPLAEYARLTANVPPPTPGTATPTAGTTPPPTADPNAPEAADPGETPAARAAREAEALRGALQVGQALLAQGDVDAAIVALRRAINLSPRDGGPRTILARAYLQANRPADAVAEARRGLAVVADGPAQVELTRILAQGFAGSGDRAAARATYEQIVAARPNATWARVALADILIAEGRTVDAETQLRAIRKSDPTNQDAARRLIRLRIASGDFATVLTEVGNEPDPALRAALIRDIFDTESDAIIAGIERNRKAFDGNQISREAFYRAASSQSERATTLLNLMQGATPANEAAGSPKLMAHRRRVLAASLLVQSAATLLTYLENGETSAGAQASLLLTEARKEIAQARAIEPSSDRTENASSSGGTAMKPN